MEYHSPERRTLRSAHRRLGGRNSDDENECIDEVRSPMRPEISTEAYKRRQRFQNRQKERSNRFNKFDTMKQPTRSPLLTQNQTNEGKFRSSPYTSPSTDWGSIMDDSTSETTEGTDDGIEQIVSSLRQRHSKSFSKDPSKWETDPEVLQRRQKQIDYGQNTPEYQSYIAQVPRSERTKFHPSTPEKDVKYSRRSWDTMVKIWRKQLHVWDPKPNH